MKIRSILSYLILAACMLALMPVVHAQDEQSSTVIYQTTFSTDPRWVTNNPSTDYWDSSLGMYHFSLDPTTGGYAYVPVEYDRGPFKLEYDLILNSIDEDAIFRLAFSGTEMDTTKGPNVATQFTNAKYGQIMSLHLVTPGNKMVEVNSQSGDTQTSGPKAYDGPTVKYELNKTYHVTTNYDSENKLISMKVSEKTSGKDIWSYFVNTGEDLSGMNRIYLGLKGDYGWAGKAQGYIDNVRLTATTSITLTPTASVTAETTLAPTMPTAKVSPIKPISTVLPAETPKSPLSPVLSVAALCIAGLCIVVISLRRRN
jgi:hypothetical protein